MSSELETLPLIRVQREVLLLQQKANAKSAEERRRGNSKDAAHYDTAAIILNEVASLIADELLKIEQDRKA